MKTKELISKDVINELFDKYYQKAQQDGLDWKEAYTSASIRIKEFLKINGKEMM